MSKQCCRFYCIRHGNHACGCTLKERAYQEIWVPAKVHGAVMLNQAAEDVSVPLPSEPMTVASLVAYLLRQYPDALVLTGTGCIADYVWRVSRDNIYSGIPRTDRPLYYDVDISHYDQSVIIL